MGSPSLPLDLEGRSQEKPVDDGIKRMHLLKSKSAPTLWEQCKMAPVAPFAGRLGGNQAFVIDRDASDEDSAKLLEEQPDAARGMTLRQQFDCRPLLSMGLWKAAGIEAMGSMMLVFITVWANISPNVIPTPPDEQWGLFANAAFVGPTVGAIINFLIVTLFTFSFGSVSGAHFNPLITLGTFFARLSTFPRSILYICGQSAGASLGGLLVRASYGSRDFKTGGCWLYSDVMPVKDAFVIEFMGSLVLLFIAFGVGLDPRQQKTIPPALSPFLVGGGLALVSWSTAFARYGYGGASLNPARCLGAFVGSHVPGWHWYEWIAPLCAAILHALTYHMVPPGQAAY